MGGGKRRHLAPVWFTMLSLVGGASAAPLAGISTGGILFDINSLTGQASNPWNTGLGAVVGMAFSPDKRLYVLTDGVSSSHPAWLYAIDFNHGITPIGPTGLPALSEGDIAFDPVTGVLYGGYDAESNERRLFTLNVLTGAATYLPTTPGGDISAMAFDQHNSMFVLDTSVGRLLTVDKITGAPLTTVTLSRALGATAGMSFDPDTGALYVVDGGAGTGTLYKLNPTTGVLTTVGPTGVPGGFAGLTFVPEPCTLVLLALGAAVAARRRA